MRHANCLAADVAAFAVLSSLVLFPTPGQSACNDPPDPAQVEALGRWQSHVGGIDSPFLIPGKRIGKTDERTTALRGAAVTNTDVVSIAFVGGTLPPVLLVLADDCNTVDLSACTNAFCEKEKLDYGTAVNPPIPWVSFTAKDFEVNGVLRAGQVRLAASSASQIPCALTTTPCATLSPQPHVCIDELVTTQPGSPRTVTALPPPNDFSKICTTAPGTLPPCAGGGTDLVMALDSRGDLNIPMDWGRIVRDSSNNDCVEAPSAPPCKKRDVTAKTPVPAVTSTPIQVANDHLQSLNAVGEMFNPGPEFKTVSNTDALDLYGTVDKAFSVIRILGCPASNVDCTTRAFDFWSRREPGGPVIITRKGNGKGSCAVSGADCEKASDCPAGAGPCIGFSGVAKGYTMNIPPVHPPTPVKGFIWPYILMGIALVGLALLFYRNQRGGGL